MFNRKGQSTVEYALIIAVVIAGLLLMQHYIRRGYAGKLKSSSDDIGEQFDPTTYTANFGITKTSLKNTTVQNQRTETLYQADEIDRKDINREQVGAWQADGDLYAQ